MLQGERVRLRAVRAEDRDMLTAWISEPEIMQFIIPRFPMSPLAEERWIEQMATSATDEALVMEAEDETPIGSIGLHGIDRCRGQASLGMFIHRPEYRGRGYGSDAIRTLLHHAFHHMGLRRIWLTVHDDNGAAIRAYRRCGFGLQGCLRQDRWRTGGWRNTLLMAVMRDDFLAGRPTPDTVEVIRR